ncbi:MAG: DUF3592 domain-containing protein, partial [Spirochaetes bacterium]|nr:DUF3592 domain-containing protein [Spirochaetota bacterium]
MPKNENYARRVFAPQNRNVPLIVILNALLNNIPGLLGTIFLFLGLVTFVFLLPQVDFSILTNFGKVFQKTEGVVLSVEKTSIHVNNDLTYAYKFSYTIEEKKYESVSYSSEKDLTSGAKVAVEYSVTDPSLSRIEGMMIKPVGLWALIFLLIPAVGIFLLVFTLKKNYPAVQALKNGIMTRAVFIRKEETNIKVKNRSVYNFYYKFTDFYGEERTASGSSHKVESFDNIKDTEVIYNPASSYA